MAGQIETPGQSSAPRAQQDDASFDAILRPHRSLSAAGFGALMVALAIGMSVLGFAFAAIGAWPVLAFCGFEFALVCVAFRANYRDGRAYEHLRLNAAALEVRRVDGSGRPRGMWQFHPNWLRVTIDDPPQHDSQLVLSSHGNHLAIGSFLTPGERRDLALALRRAVEVWRTAPPAGANVS